MTDISFSGLAIVAAVGFGVPLLLGLWPRVRLPSAVAEVVVGIVIGPAVLGWVEIDAPIQVLSLLGLAALLFLAGLEIEFRRLKGTPLRLAGAGFLISLGLALGVGYGLKGLGLIQAPVFVGIVLSATALGLVVPILKDAGELATDFGQLVIAAATIADFATVILLSLFFSRELVSATSQAAQLAGFLLVAAAVVVLIVRGARWPALSAVLRRLQDTTAQIRVRGAALLLVAFAALAERFGLETILAAFIGGAILAPVAQDPTRTHPLFRAKLEAIGFGVLVPVFFVTSGMRLNLHALFDSRSGLLQVPVYVVALLVVRGLPAGIYSQFVGKPRAAAAGLLQATSLSFIVAAVQIGMELKLISEATGAALVTASLVSVLLFPLAAAMVLREAGSKHGRGAGEPVLSPPA